MARVKAPRFIANFDSASAMLRATANYLGGRDFPALGLSPWLEIPAARANLLPSPIRKALYLYSGWYESIPAKEIPTVDSEALSDWVARVYPDRTYPAVAVGSSNGAAVHLQCALGIPWLPQTFLVPVRQAVHPDEPRKAMRIGLELGRELLSRNPDLQLHHMHDGNQDRLTIRQMTYFRVKRRRLGRGYERFLEERLPPGGTILVVECERRWPVVRIDDRYVFQHGAVGGATEEEYYRGSERVAAYLEAHGSPHRRWDSPQPDEWAPEAEWGFEPALLDDIRRVAAERRYHIVRMRFPEPQALSPLVADLYRWWYRSRNIRAGRLVVESFVVLEPFWVLRTGSTPFWLEFNTEPSLRAVHGYLDSAEAFEEIGLMLFNHGVRSVGVPTAEEWEKVLARAKRNGRWLGADPPEFPMDYAQFARYHGAIKQIRARYPLPGRLTIRQLRDFLAERADAYRVRLEEERPLPHRR